MRFGLIHAKYLYIFSLKIIKRMEKQRTNWLLVVAFCMTLLNANATVLTQTPSVKSVETAAQMSTADLEKTLT